METGSLDASDRRLVQELEADARLSLAELGRRVGLSPPAVRERLARLEGEGVIRGYRADVDPRATGWPIGAFVRIRPAPRELAKVADVIRATPEVVECHRITGEDCFLLRLHVRALEDLEGVLDRFTPWGQTTTSIIASTPVPLRALPLSAPAPPRSRSGPR